MFAAAEDAPGFAVAEYTVGYTAGYMAGYMAVCIAVLELLVPPNPSSDPGNRF